MIHTHTLTLARPLARNVKVGKKKFRGIENTLCGNSREAIADDGSRKKTKAE